jgi:hypothetical protein
MVGSHELLNGISFGKGHEQRTHLTGLYAFLDMLVKAIILSCILTYPHTCWGLSE